MRARWRPVLVAVAAVTLAACPSDDPDPEPDPSATATPTNTPSITPSQSESDESPDEVQEGFALWQQQRPELYVMSLEVTCFCTLSGTWQAWVDGDRVEDHSNLSRPGDNRGDPPPTIDELYRALISRTRGWPDARVGLSVDELGVPESASFDERDTDDEEITWVITDFAVWTSGPAEAQRGLELWRSAGPESYRMTIEIICLMCADSGRWRVEVDEGEVVSADPLDEYARGKTAGVPRTIDELYDELVVRLSSDSDGWLQLTVDDRGVPVRAAFDIPRAIDDELSWRITRFEPQ